MRRPTVLAIASALLLACGGAVADEPAAEEDPGGYTVAVATFRGPVESLQQTITATFAADLALSESLRIVERPRLEDAAAELELAEEHAVDASSAPEIGRLVAADKVIVGEFSLIDGMIHLSARLVDVATGEVEGGSGAVVEGNIKGSRRDIYGLVHQLASRFHRRLTGEWLPNADVRRLSTMLELLEKIDPTTDLQRQERRIEVELKLDRGAYGAYHLGERIQMTVEVDQPSSVYIYNVDARQRVALIFPNKEQRDNRLIADRTYELPPPDGDWEFFVKSGPGQEKMIAIATEVPLEIVAPETGKGFYVPIRDTEHCAESLREFIETALNPYLGETAAGAWGIDVVNFFTVPAAEPAEDQ